MKTCNKCNEEKNLSEFAWRKKSKGTKQPYCRTCRKKIDRTRYESSPKRRRDIKDKRKERGVRNRKWLAGYLKDKQCIDCGYDNWIAFEFDHRDEKNYDISYMVRHGYAIDSIKAEMELCDLVCANCHRIRTMNRNGYYRINY